MILSQPAPTPTHRDVGLGTEVPNAKPDLVDTLPRWVNLPILRPGRPGPILVFLTGHMYIVKILQEL